MFPLQQLGSRVVDKNAGAGVRDKNENFHPGNAWGPDGKGQGEDCMLCGSLVGNVAREFITRFKKKRLRRVVCVTKATNSSSMKIGRLQDLPAATVPTIES